MDELVHQSGLYLNTEITDSGTTNDSKIFKILMATHKILKLVNLTFFGKTNLPLLDELFYQFVDIFGYFSRSHKTVKTIMVLQIMCSDYKNVYIKTYFQSSNPLNC